MACMAATLDHVTLRTYRPEDLAAVLEIDHEFQREVGFDSPDRPHRADFDDIAGVYLNAGGQFWVAEYAGGEIVGYGAVLRIDETTARLRRFRVRPDWRRRGLAALLLQEAERFCLERGYRRITLGTTDQQQPAQAFYRKHGYVAVGEHWLTPDVREIEFEKQID